MRGSGTSSDPYIVDTDADLKALGTNIGTYANTYIELGADIVCSGDQTPIGNSSTKFSGHFDGKNHIIINLNVSGGSYQGLFGYCTGGFSITNLKLVNGHVTATSTNCGMVIGYVGNASNAVVENIETDGCKVDSMDSTVGGIVGNGASSSSGAVTYRNCYVHDGYVVGTFNARSVGGIVGSGTYSSSGAILYENCRVVSEYVLSGIDSTGGIVGRGASSRSSTNVTYRGCEVRDCVIKSSSYTVGGIVGYGTYNGSSVTYDGCGVYNTMVWSTYSSDAYVGGIAGNISNTATIKNPVVDGCTIIAPNGNFVAGVCGAATGTVSISNPTVRNCSIIGNGTSVGGVVGST